MKATESGSYPSDYDYNKLRKLDKQIHHTDPKSAGSDGDEAFDGEMIGKSANLLI